MATVPLLPQFLAGELVPETPKAGWWPVRRRIELAHEHAQGAVLDCGAGTGWLTMHLEAWGHDVTATDLDEQAIANYRRNQAIVGSRVDVRREDITRMTLEDDRFDSVFCFSVLEHIADLDAALGELERVMRPGGVLVVGVPNVLGAYSLLNDHDPRALLRRRRRGDIREDHEHLHTPRWWHRRLAERFVVHRSIPLELLTPVIARFAGYDVDERWTRTDVRVAAHLPRVLASDVLFVLRRP